MDILENVYEILAADPFIQTEVQDRIKFYKYPENGDMDKPIIVLEEVVPPDPDDYADNNWLTEDFFLHIEVWVKGKGGRKKRDQLAKRVRDLMWSKLGFAQVGAMPPEWDKDYKIYRDARRYRGKLYRDDLDAL